jgi:hypothetical protein
MRVMTWLLLLLLLLVVVVVVLLLVLLLLLCCINIAVHGLHPASVVVVLPVRLSPDPHADTHSHNVLMMLGLSH